MRRTAGAAVLTLTVCACSSAPDADIAAAKRFRGFPLYWVGERFEGWKLAGIDGLDGPAPFVTFIYGTCTPHGGDEPSCTPPLQIQVSPLCRQLAAVARAQIWKRRRIRGAPVGTIDSAPVLFTAGAKVKVYRGEGSDPGLATRALAAIRSINAAPPVIGDDGPIPAPSESVLAGRRPCQTPR
ncbi:MAG TPA: hypothetical protein VF101_04135 [Gaiellaceae bacterium]